MTKKISLPAIVAGLLFSGMFTSTTVIAKEFITGGSGEIVRDGFGECVTEGGIRHHHDFDADHCSKPKAAAKPKPKPRPVPKPVVEEKITLGAHALFDTNKSELRPAGIAELDALVSKLKAFIALDSITITGHTDSRGAKAYNQGLSERRAAAVKAYLVSKGVPGSAIDTHGAGETSPVATNDTVQGRQQNRRVEIEIKARK